jgi:glycosyltransferase involved in cell wall biosynthesis
MNIAVVFTKDVNEGGAFQYAVSIALLLEKNKLVGHRFIYFTTVKSGIGNLKKYDIPVSYLRWSNFDRFMAALLSSQIVNNIFAKAKITLELKLDKIFKKSNIDLVYFLSPTDLALALNCYGYIFTLWDLCFLDHPEFPEVYINREFERREKLYRLAILKAVAVTTDSEFTKDNLIRKYGIVKERVISLPLLPSSEIMNIPKEELKRNFIKINEKYKINGKYIFYPAQFWPHKNHLYILEGLKLLKEKYRVEIHALFSGFDKGNLRFILSKAKEFGIENLIHYIGFVEDKELPYLYSQAIALVMPTYFGPTNIPPLEAFALGCPVLYSDLPGLREQVEGAALLLKLDDPESFCQGLLSILKGGPEIEIMIENAKKKIRLLAQDDRWAKLKTIFDDYAIKSKCRERN